jgi:hypothetical protein
MSHLPTEQSLSGVSDGDETPVRNHRAHDETGAHAIVSQFAFRT